MSDGFRKSFVTQFKAESLINVHEITTMHAEVDLCKPLLLREFSVS